MSNSSSPMTRDFVGTALSSAKTRLEVDLLNAIVRALQNKNTDYGKRMRGVALGLLRASEIYECFDKHEVHTLNRILELAK